MPYITIPQRQDKPEASIFVKILRKNKNLNAPWDRPVMILIHGGPGGNHTLYSDIENDLFELADLVIPDLRGCGLSSKAKVLDCTLNTHINDIDSLIRVLSISEPVIHGCSYGGIVALGYGAKFPNNISTLILSSCAVSGQFIDNAKRNLLNIGTSEQIAIAENLWNGTFKSADHFSDFYRIMAPLYIYNLNISHIPSTQVIPYNYELVNISFTTFLTNFDFTKNLSHVNAPTLIFSGNNDWIIDCNQAKIINDGIKNSKLVNLDKCGHFPWKDRRSDFLINLTNFLS